MLYVCIVFAIIAPYLICSINPAIIVTKIKSGEDIRKLGSGGAGLTNVLRTQGKTAAVFVLLGDVLKGVVSILLIKLFCHFFLPADAYSISDIDPPIEYAGYFPYLCMWLGSLSAVLGHCFPLYYKFKGGKAVLVTVATGLIINWLAALMALIVFIIIVALTRYVSLGSIIAAALYPVCVWVAGTFILDIHYTYIGVIFTSVIAMILIFMHRQNIKRLINKNEKKLGQSERKR
ncbi:MAG: glycerol-3-phosphate 1-O-acyltransferase PlsY [Oscillospiraceae bacterium]|jgi:glycerol-3-phosphate acyltransferase PlsY|nr:glycerol-3-phosphate 1-O-acyltransferase PlsY [Oscillospiraceae bacterium]